MNPLGQDIRIFFEQTLNGLTLGGIYALIAIGYTMVYGILELINFAHGEIYMLGAMITILVVVGIVLPVEYLLILALILSIVYSASVAYTMEKAAYRPLRYAPRLSPLLCALGISYFLKEFVRLTAGSSFIPVRAEILEHTLLQTSYQIFGVPVRLIQLGIIGACILLMFALRHFILYTRYGVAMRATAQDKMMTQLLGVSIDRVISLTFILGASLAAAGGMMITLYIGSAEFNIGFLAGLKAFTAAVVGGIGNIQGAVLGGYLMGLSEAYFAGYISSAYKDVFAFLLLIFVLLVKPSGMLGEQVAERL